MDNYKRIDVKALLTIEKIVLLYTFNLTDFNETETHDYWELIFIEEGCLQLIVEGKQIHLSKQNMILLPPNTKHTSKCKYAKVKIVSFEGKGIEVLPSKKSFSINTSSSNAFCGLIDAGTLLFEEILDRQGVWGIRVKSTTQAYTLHDLKNRIEMFLLDFFSYSHLGPPPRKTAKNKEVYDYEFCENVIGFLRQNVTQNFRLEEIAAHFGISTAYLKKVFHVYYERGIIDLFIDMKIDRACEMILCSTKNFTQIADELGFYSVHYFSKLFKRRRGMSPTEFSKAIR